MDLPRNAPKACLLDHVCHGKVIYHDHGGPEQLQVELLEQQGAATLIWWTGIYFYKAGGGVCAVVVGDESYLHHGPPTQPIVKFDSISQVSTHRGQSFLHFKYVIRQSWITNNQQRYFIPSGKSCHSPKIS